MATHDYIIANADGATVRADINDALEAIVSNNSSGSEPATTYSYMWWADTTNGLLKIRNAADSAWLTLAKIETSGNLSFVTNLKVNGSSASAASLTLYEDTDNGTNYVELKAPASVASNLTFILPSTDGSDGQVLKTDGSGNLSFVTDGGASDLDDGSATTPAVNFSADTNTGVYRPGTDRLGFAAGGALVGEFDSSTFKFNSGYGSVATAYGCRAWVNFNGTGTVAIREDGNVSSITDNGTGDYTVNFTTAMPDINYTAVANVSNILGTIASGAVNLYSTGAATQEAPTTGSFRFVTPSYNWTGGTSGRHDPQYVNVAVFR